MTKMQDLGRLGQAVWLDYIHRSLIQSGRLRSLVDQGLRGMTSNPSIFEQAINHSQDYDEQLHTLLATLDTPQPIYEALVVKDIQDAADVLRPVYDRTGGLDGYVSLEANPYLADDTGGTIQEIKRLRSWVNRPNVMYKIPATAAGIPAIEQLVGEGININITLMFSMDHYEKVSNAYLNGLEKLVADKQDIARVASVASFFVSRVDTKVDKRLADLKQPELQGKIAIANAKVVYARFTEILNSERWHRLNERGAQVQRPLWASTSTKNPAYSDVLYVDDLIGPQTVTTITPTTLDAFQDHGTVAVTIERDLETAKAQLRQVRELGIDLHEVGEELQREGVAQFIKGFDELMKGISAQKARIVRAS